MKSDNNGLFHQPNESDEQHRHRLQEQILSEDWVLMLSSISSEFSALGSELVEEQDPNKIIDLTEQRQILLTDALGAGVIGLWQRDILAERRQFENDFGQSE